MAVQLERTASELHREKKIEEAFEAFDEAGRLYRDTQEHLKAAVCFASAASCWNILTGMQPLGKAASRNYYAAKEALKGKNFEYARALYRDAALLYEKDGDSENYSKCFIESKRADAQKNWLLFSRAQTSAGIPFSDVRLMDRLIALRRWLMNQLSFYVWGYGELPFRTMLLASLIIIGNAFIYTFAPEMITPHGPSQLNFWDALYMSAITFSTVGYGDYLPLGWARIFASLEALSGILIAPLFLVSLTRRYLRIDR